MLHVKHLPLSQVQKKIVRVERMRKKDGEEAVIKPVIVELESERDKWEVIEGKAALRQEEKWKKVFLELDLSREKREERRLRAMERKEERKRKDLERKKEEETKKKEERRREEVLK